MDFADFLESASVMRAGLKKTAQEVFTTVLSSFLVNVVMPIVLQRRYASHPVYLGVYV